MKIEEFSKRIIKEKAILGDAMIKIFHENVKMEG